MRAVQWQLLGSILLLNILGCNGSRVDAVQAERLRDIDTDSIELLVQRFLLSRVHGLKDTGAIKFKSYDYNVELDEDFDGFHYFSVVQEEWNDFDRFCDEKGRLKPSNTSLVDGWTKLSEEQRSQPFKEVQYWLLRTTILRGDLDGNVVQDYAIKVLKVPAGCARALWISEWYVLKGSETGFDIEQIHSFTGTWRFPGYDVVELRRDTLVGAFQHYNEEWLPVNTESSIDSNNQVLLCLENGSLSFEEGHFFKVPLDTVSGLGNAERRLAQFDRADYTVGLDRVDGDYEIFLGPFSSRKMGEWHVREAQKEIVFAPYSDWGLLQIEDSFK